VVDLIDIADEFHFDKPPVLCLERHVLVPHVFFRLQFQKGGLAFLDTSRWAYLPELLSDEILVRVTK